MKASELRIGNLVKYQNAIIEVNYIIESRIGFGHGIKFLHEPSYQFEPIPLTEEWHNKFGVKKYGFGNFVYKLPRKNNIDIAVAFINGHVMLRQGKNRIDGNIIFIWNKDVTKRNMFVHEWQNLYFALTGEELTIKNQ